MTTHFLSSNNTTRRERSIDKLHLFKYTFQCGVKMMLQLSIPQCLLLLTKDKMVNSNRGPGGRFTSRPVNNSVKVHSRPQSASDNGECSNKKRRLNDGSSQVPIKAPEQQAPKATDPPPPPSTPPSRLSQPARRATPATPSERRTRPVETPSKTEEGRTLRSKDVARPRSELVNFFADFEPIVFGSPKPDGNNSLKVRRCARR